MIVDVSTILNCSAAKAWNEVQKSSLHRHVIRPLARLVPGGAPLPERWSEVHTIQCKLFVFGVIPIGVRTLHFEKNRLQAEGCRASSGTRRCPLARSEKRNWKA